MARMGIDHRAPVRLLLANWVTRLSRRPPDSIRLARSQPAGNLAAAAAVIMRAAGKRTKWAPATMGVNCAY